MDVRIGSQAVVIGAGMSGLAAARALADHFEQVIVLERDGLPLDTAPRPGTPQARHLHGLLGGGQRALGELFPGFQEDLDRAGAVPLRAGFDILYERPGYPPFPRHDLGWRTFAMSRPLLELAVRRRVERYANIAIRQRCRVLDIVVAPDGGNITAVRYETIDGKRDRLPADLVVDASGRGSLTVGLLQSIGRPLPEETVIGIDLVYSTAVFVIPGDAPPDWKGVYSLPRVPESSRSGVLLPVEKDCWILTVSGQRGEWPPEDPDGFMAFVRRLATPTIHDAIRDAERLGEIARFGFAESVWRRYDQLEVFPRGLLPIGDAICRFNPIYGQGMSVAFQEACLLHRLLKARAGERDPLAGLGQAFLAEAQPLIAAPWAMSAVPDLAFPETRGDRPADFDRSRKFAHALGRLADRDPVVFKLVTEVRHLLQPPSAYHVPELMHRVEAEMAET